MHVLNAASDKSVRFSLGQISNKPPVGNVEDKLRGDDLRENFALGSELLLLPVVVDVGF